MNKADLKKRVIIILNRLHDCEAEIMELYDAMRDMQHDDELTEHHERIEHVRPH